jgi:uncharacterized protein
MSVELRPLGVACNLSCDYCYQDPQRESGNFRQPYDLEKMKAAVERAGGPFVMFGGEPLLVPLADLEALFRWGLERYGRNAVQTNGALVTEAHLRLFREYKVDVGISLDGPAELNDARSAGSEERTRAATAAVEAVIERLCRDGRPPGLIVTLHRGNATADKLPAMHAWMRRLDALGVSGVRLHLLEVDAPGVRARRALSPRENVEALASFAELQGELTRVRFDVFQDLEKLLLAQDRGSACVWQACDPYDTRAVQGVEGNGQSSNCGRTNKDGIDFTKADETGFERYVALARTPQEDGGCRGCRFFLMCKGQCPGTALDGDFRNRTEHCEVWKALFTRVERQLVRAGQTPLTLTPVRHWMEARLIAEWSAGRNGPLAGAPAEPPPGATPPWRFARQSWVSDAARATWQPRLEGIAAALAELALRRVIEGLSPCLTARVAPAEVFPFMLRAAEHGLRAELLGEPPPGAEGAAPAGWAREARWVVIGRPPERDAYRRLRAAGDDAALAALLGVPACCAAAEARRAAGDPEDPSWAMARATRGAAPGPALELTVAPALNPLLRRLGLGLLPHRPCALDCAPSLALADRLVALGRAAGHGPALDTLLELLGAPVSWTALHGIAELKTPHFKMIHDTPYTARPLVLALRGRALEAAPVRGLQFPYAAPRRSPSLPMVR